MNEKSPPNMAAMLAKHMADTLEAAAPIAEASTGYRAQLEAAGYSPTIAEHIAAQFHMMMLTRLFKPGAAA